MARRQVSKPPQDISRRPSLVVSRAEAVDRIQTQAAKGKDLRGREINSPTDLKRARDDFSTWDDYNKELLTRIVDTDDLRTDYSHASVTFLVVDQTFREEVSEFREDVDQKIRRLESILGRLDLIPEALGIQVQQASTTEAARRVSTRVFLVHGHDEEAKQVLGRFLERLGLQPIILHEQPNRGRTIIEKFEDYSDVGFAVILLTPDDLCTPDAVEAKPVARARQNVVLELGFFLGRLGRDRVCALHKSGTEIPSDLAGVVYVPLDDHGAWQLALGREMKAAGIPVDLNRLA